jgi:predicted RNA binding protein YcfA (HicA-like mRNA interferase family)
MKFRELRRLLNDLGYRLDRQRGSHQIWVHPELPGSVVVAGKDSGDVPIGTLKSIMGQLEKDQR